MMRFLVDENVDRLLVNTLRRAGHDVVYVAEQQAGQADEVVTDDLDFGHLTAFEGPPPPAIILVRLDRLTRVARTARVIGALTKLVESVFNNLVVIEPGRLRLRSFENFNSSR